MRRVHGDCCYSGVDVHSDATWACIEQGEDGRQQGEHRQAPALPPGRGVPTQRSATTTAGTGGQAAIVDSPEWQAATAIFVKRFDTATSSSAFAWSVIVGIGIGCDRVEEGWRKRTKDDTESLIHEYP